MVDTLTLVVTVVLALAAIASSAVTYWALRRNVDPSVVVYADEHPTQATLIVIVIENVGAGVAYDVRFELEDELPIKAWGLTEEKAKEPEIMNGGPLVSGIPALGPGSKRVINWGQFGGLKKALGTRAVGVNVSFEARHRLFWDSDRMSTSCFLESASFEGTTAAPTKGSALIAGEIKRVGASIDKLSQELRALADTAIDSEPTISDSRDGS